MLGIQMWSDWSFLLVDFLVAGCKLGICLCWIFLFCLSIHWGESEHIWVAVLGWIAFWLAFFSWFRYLVWGNMPPSYAILVFLGEIFYILDQTHYSTFNYLTKMIRSIATIRFKRKHWHTIHNYNFKLGNINQEHSSWKSSQSQDVTLLPRTSNSHIKK